MVLLHDETAPKFFAMFFAASLLPRLAQPARSAGRCAAPVWVASWGASQQIPEPQNALPAEDLRDATVRQIFHLSAGGSALRVHLSNAFGTEPLHFTSVHVARPLSPHPRRRSTPKATAPAHLRRQRRRDDPARRRSCLRSARLFARCAALRPRRELSSRFAAGARPAIPDRAPLPTTHTETSVSAAHLTEAEARRPLVPDFRDRRAGRAGSVPGRRCARRLHH
jgi:hypothetical protein